jgi:hypothetical protein
VFGGLGLLAVPGKIPMQLLVHIGRWTETGRQNSGAGHVTSEQDGGEGLSFHRLPRHE